MANKDHLQLALKHMGKLSLREQKHARIALDTMIENKTATEAIEFHKSMQKGPWVTPRWMHDMSGYLKKDEPALIMDEYPVAKKKYKKATAKLLLQGMPAIPGKGKSAVVKKWAKKNKATLNVIRGMSK